MIEADFQDLLAALAPAAAGDEPGGERQEKQEAAGILTGVPAPLPAPQIVPLEFAMPVTVEEPVSVPPAGAAPEPPPPPQLIPAKSLPESAAPAPGIAFAARIQALAPEPASVEAANQPARDETAAGQPESKPVPAGGEAPDDAPAVATVPSTNRADAQEASDDKPAARPPRPKQAPEIIPRPAAPSRDGDPAAAGPAAPHARPVIRGETNISEGLPPHDIVSQVAETRPVSGRPQMAEPPPAGPIRDISVRLSGPRQDPVELRIADRGGEVRVAVRTPDAHLSQALGEHLPDLVSSLEQRGLNAETWRPVEAVAPARELRTERGAASDMFQQSSPQDGRQDAWGGREGKQQQQQRPHWVDEIEDGFGLPAVSQRSFQSWLRL